VRCPRCLADNPASSRYCAGCGASLTPIPDAPDESRTQTLAPPSDPFSTGILFAGRYQIIEELGRGGMGRVYKAFDTKIQERIAVKIIRPEIAGDEKTIARFRNELKLARQITHRNVCRTHDLGDSGGTHYITMEYVAGENLQKIMRMTRPLSIGRAVDYARQIAEGLSEAHRLGVVHRDLKPQNIIIDEAGTAKIMDFGIARTVDAAGQTQEGMMIGTPEYMAPEQAEGKPADPRADIYALGIILYEMVAGQRPFSGDTPLSVALKQKAEVPQPPVEWNTQIPGALNALILKCLEKDKAKRYQAAAEVAAELAAIGDALPRSGEYRRAGRTRAFPARRKRPWVIAAASAAAVVLAVLGYFLVLKPPRAVALAVLPFKDLSPGQNQGLLCEGLADDIRIRLSEMARLKVSLKDSSDQWKASRKTIVDFGRDLHVQKTVSGTLRVENGEVLLNVELGDAVGGFISLTRTFQARLEELNRLVAEVAGAVGRELRVGAAAGALPLFTGRETSKLDAYLEYREGMRVLTGYRNLGKNEDFQAAVSRFQKAVELDPGYCLAHVGLGDAYEARLGRTPEPSEAVPWQTAMEASYRRAYEINADLPESLLGLGWVYFHREDFDQAFGYFQRAVAMDPRNQQVVYGTGSFLRSIGLYENALKYYQRAIDLDPLAYRAYLTCISCLSYSGRFEDALELAKRAVEIEPAIPRTHAYYARQLILAGRLDEADQELKRGEEIDTADPALFRLRIWLTALRGRRNEAQEMISRLERPEDLLRYEVTNAQAILGLEEEVIQSIRAGIGNGFRLSKECLYTHLYLIHNPYFRSLMGHPRFKEILASEKLKYEESMRKFGAL